MWNQYGLLQVFLFIFFLVFLSRASKKSGAVFICILSLILMLSFFSSDFVDHRDDQSEREREREAFSVTPAMQQSFTTDQNKCAMLSSVSSVVRTTLCDDPDIKNACKKQCVESCKTDTTDQGEQVETEMPGPRTDPYQIVITNVYTR